MQVRDAPGLLWPAGRRLEGDRAAGARECQTLWLLFLAGLVVVYAAWWSWYGGEVWGPRFVLPVIPLCIFFAMLVLEKKAVRFRRLRWTAIGVLCAAGVAIQIGGSSFHFHEDAVEYRGRKWEREYLGWYVPQLSPILRIWRHFGKVWLHYGAAGFNA